MQLNKNNFLRWDGEFNSAPFTNTAMDDESSMTVINSFDDIFPLANDISTFGVDPNTLEITLQDNLVNPATWNPVTLAIRYYPPVGVTPSDKTLKYRWKDLEGNQSNEATIVVHITARTIWWRAHPPSFTCVLDGGSERTGYSMYTLLQAYYPDNGATVTPLQTRPNDIGDPFYVAPLLDPIHCPTEDYIAWEIYGGFATEIEACDATGAFTTFYTNNTTTEITVGVELFTDSALTTHVPEGYYSYGTGYIWQVVGNFIVDQIICE